MVEEKKYNGITRENALEGLSLARRVGVKVAHLSGRLTRALTSRYNAIKAEVNKLHQEALDMHAERQESRIEKAETKIGKFEDKKDAYADKLVNKYDLEEKAKMLEELEKRIAEEDMSLYGPDGPFASYEAANYVLHSQEKLYWKIENKFDKKTQKYESKMDKQEAKVEKARAALERNGQKKIKIPQYDLLVLSKKVGGLLKKGGEKVLQAGAIAVAGAVAAGSAAVAKTADAIQSFKDKREARRAAEVDAMEEIEPLLTNEEFIQNFEANYESYKMFKDAVTNVILNEDNLDDPNYRMSVGVIEAFKNAGFSKEQIQVFEEYSKAQDKEVEKPIAKKQTVKIEKPQKEVNDDILRSVIPEVISESSDMKQEDIDLKGLQILEFLENTEKRSGYNTDRKVLENLIRNVNTFTARKAELNPKDKSKFNEITKTNLVGADTPERVDDLLKVVEDQVIQNMLSSEGITKVLLAQSKRVQENPNYGVDNKRAAEIQYKLAVQKMELQKAAKKEADKVSKKNENKKEEKPVTMKDIVPKTKSKDAKEKEIQATKQKRAKAEAVKKIAQVKVREDNLKKTKAELEKKVSEAAKGKGK